MSFESDGNVINRDGSVILGGIRARAGRKHGRYTQLYRVRSHESNFTEAC
jgi:hypothetical protein